MKKNKLNIPIITDLQTYIHIDHTIRNNIILTTKKIKTRYIHDNRFGIRLYKIYAQ